MYIDLAKIYLLLVRAPTIYVSTAKASHTQAVLFRSFRPQFNYIVL
jgi:hypothetical protein